MISRFRLFKKGDAEHVVGEGARFSNGRIACTFNETLDVGTFVSMDAFRDNLKASRVDVDWIDIPDEDFSEQVASVS